MPFAGYKDFKDCVQKNKKKVSNPQAYCASIERKVEDYRKKKGKNTSQLMQNAVERIIAFKELIKELRK